MAPYIFSTGLPSRLDHLSYLQASDDEKLPAVMRWWAPSFLEALRGDVTKVSTWGVAHIRALRSEGKHFVYMWTDFVANSVEFRHGTFSLDMVYEFMEFHGPPYAVALWREEYAFRRAEQAREKSARAEADGRMLRRLQREKKRALR